MFDQGRVLFTGEMYVTTFPNIYTLNCDLSGGQRYLTFELRG